MNHLHVDVSISYVGDGAIEKWKEFLRADALANGGSASVVVRRIDDNKPIKITVFDDGLIVVEIMTGFDLAEELAALYAETQQEPVQLLNK